MDSTFSNVFNDRRDYPPPIFNQWPKMGGKKGGVVQKSTVMSATSVCWGQLVSMAKCRDRNGYLGSFQS